MMTNLGRSQNDFVIQFNDWLNSYLSESRNNPNIAEVLQKSQEYSLLSGGKRFRPFLTFLIFSLYSTENFKVKNLCLALEMIHTYSLIHDDLPCMDNDDFRRGKPTNHKVYSESIALLAGDGLLTDVFSIISKDELLSDSVKIKLIRLISEKIGSAGMVSGQVFDMKADRTIVLADLKKIHRLKTANLIQAAAVAGGMVAECSDHDLNLISEFSYNLGMAFQIKDDLLDFNDKEQDHKSYLSQMGFEKTSTELNQYSSEAAKYLASLKLKTEILQELIDYNLKRNS